MCPVGAVLGITLVLAVIFVVFKIRKDDKIDEVVRRLDK